MQLTQKELKDVRCSRIEDYKARLEIEVYHRNFSGDAKQHTLLVSDIDDLMCLILEVTNELNSRFPNWDECPF